MRALKALLVIALSVLSLAPFGVPRVQASITTVPGSPYVPWNSIRD